MLFNRRLGHEYIHITRGDGIYLYDETGKQYIDAVGGAGVVNLGHGLGSIAKSAYDSMAKYSFVHGAQFTTSDLQSYGQRLVALAPDNISHVQLVGSGSEAVETAIKFAYQYYNANTKNHSKYKIISTNPGYHGATGIALSVTGKFRDREKYKGLLKEHPFINAPCTYHKPVAMGETEYGHYCADLLEQQILQEGADSCLAFLVEPVIGPAMGVSVPPHNYLTLVQDICNRYDIAMICDEVMCGFGRCGSWFASDLFNVKPDIIIQGKGMAAGLLPLSAVYVTEPMIDKIQSTFGNFFHGFTFTNHTVSASVGMAVLDAMEDQCLLEKVVSSGEYLRQCLEGLTEFSWIDDIRGLGLLCGFEIIREKSSKKAFSRDSQMAERFLQKAMKKGLNLYFSIGYRDNGVGDAILVMPPFIISKSEIDVIMSILLETATELDKER